MSISGSLSPSRAVSRGVDASARAAMVGALDAWYEEGTDKSTSGEGESDACGSSKAVLIFAKAFNSRARSRNVSGCVDASAEAVTAVGPGMRYEEEIGELASEEGKGDACGSSKAVIIFAKASSSRARSRNVSDCVDASAGAVTVAGLGTRYEEEMGKLASVESKCNVCGSSKAVLIFAKASSSLAELRAVSGGVDASSGTRTGGNVDVWGVLYCVSD